MTLPILKEVQQSSSGGLIKINDVELGSKKSELRVISIGSLDEAPEKNLVEMGEFLASDFINTLNEAKKKGKKVLFDMLTGSSPKPFYEALKRRVELEKINLSENVVFFGHEAEWPPAVGNSSLDYENQRIKILKDLGVSIKEITEPGMEGNYVSMYQEKLRNGADDEEIKATAEKSAIKHDNILENLLNSGDFISVGYYGVGVDGHGFGELQLFHMWDDVWPKTEKTFITSVEDYSLEKELWRLTNPSNGSKSESNSLWERRENFPEVKYLMGLGRKTMNRLDHSVHIFNDPKKYLALHHTLISLAGSGRGESMINIFKSFAQQLEFQNIAVPNILETDNCHQIVNKILSSLGSDYDSDNYFKIAKLIEAYFGLKTPISIAISERANLDKSTTFILPANIIKDSELAYLAK